MDAAVIRVTRTLVGWLVCEGERLSEVFSSQFWALKGADALAWQRHSTTGQPVVIVLQYPGGEDFIASRYG